MTKAFHQSVFIRDSGFVHSDTPQKMNLNEVSVLQTLHISPLSFDEGNKNDPLNRPHKTKQRCLTEILILILLCQANQSGVSLKSVFSLHVRKQMRAREQMFV